jgi:thioredoxin 1
MEKIDAADLEARLNSSQYVILDFSSPGCAPCKPAAALVEEVVDEGRRAGLSIDGFVVDIAEQPAIAQKHFVLGVPTVIVFKEGREVGRFSGIPKKAKLNELLAR